MPITAEHAGRAYPPTAPVTVTQAEIDAFARAVGAAPGAEAPPTFAMRIAAPAWRQLFADPELGLALERTMHADQGFELDRPFRAGDVVTGVLTIERVRSRGEADWVSVAVALQAGDERVATATSTFICTREGAA